MEYDAASIRILSDEDQLQFDFKLVEYLADKYSKPTEWIKRSLESFRLAGVSVDLFEERYLLGNTAIVIPAEVGIISRDLQKASRA